MAQTCRGASPSVHVRTHARAPALCYVTSRPGWLGERARRSICQSHAAGGGFSIGPRSPSGGGEGPFKACSLVTHAVC